MLEEQGRDVKRDKKDAYRKKLADILGNNFRKSESIVENSLVHLVNMAAVKWRLGLKDVKNIKRRIETLWEN
jgi:hypothetical protein